VQGAEFEAWAAAQPADITADRLWKLDTYRLALYLIALARMDLDLIRRTEDLPAKAQLLSSVTSISANIAEGYSRPTPADRARFYSYALGSAREAVSWYAALRGPLPDEVVFARYSHISRIRRLLIAIQKSIHSKLPPGHFTP
jgi:four helix bundle protein